jgi:hypothetical protein
VNWAALIMAIMEVLGPLLEDCGKERLKRAAERLPQPEKFGGEGEAAAALYDEAIRMTWRPLVRLGLRRAKSASVEGKKLRKRPLTADEMAEGRDFVDCIRME